MTPVRPSITTDIGNYADTGRGDPHKTMKALTWQAPNVVQLRKSDNTCDILVKNNTLLIQCWVSGNGEAYNR